MDDIKLVSEEEDFQAVAEDMARSISKMYEDRDTKLLNAKERLVEDLEVTSRKYHTANGVMSALDTLRSVLGKHNRDYNVRQQITIAQGIARHMSNITEQLRDDARTCTPEELTGLCDDLYIQDFTNEKSEYILLTTELMVMQLCQHVGSLVDDIDAFANHTDNEIESARDNLREYCEAHDIDLEKIYGEEEDQR